TVLVSLRLRSKKRRGEQIRLQLSVANRIVPVGILPGLALGLDVFDGLFRHFLDVGRHRPESLPNGKRQSRLDAFPERLSLLLLETLGNAFVISRQGVIRSEEHTSELQSRENLVCRLLLEKKNPSRSNP